MLRRLKVAGAQHPNLPVLGVSPAQYNAHIRQALNELGLGMLGITAHSARAGFATDEVVKGTHFTTIKALGRWSSDSSLKIYLDAVMSRGISAAPDVACWQPSGVALESDLFVYFPRLL